MPARSARLRLLIGLVRLNRPLDRIGLNLCRKLRIKKAQNPITLKVIKLCASPMLIA